MASVFYASKDKTFRKRNFEFGLAPRETTPNLARSGEMTHPDRGAHLIRYPPPVTIPVARYCFLGATHRSVRLWFCLGSVTQNDMIYTSSLDQNVPIPRVGVPAVPRTTDFLGFLCN